jgi:hypothetical protein
MSGVRTHCREPTPEPFHVAVYCAAHSHSSATRRRFRSRCMHLAVSSQVTLGDRDRRPGTRLCGRKVEPGGALSRRRGQGRENHPPHRGAVGEEGWYSHQPHRDHRHASAGAVGPASAPHVRLPGVCSHPPCAAAAIRRRGWRPGKHCRGRRLALSRVARSRVQAQGARAACVLVTGPQASEASPDRVGRQIARSSFAAANGDKEPSRQPLHFIASCSGAQAQRALRPTQIHRT